MSIEIHGLQPLNIPLHTERIHMKEEGIATNSIDKIEERVNEYAAHLLDGYMRRNNIKKSNIKVTPFKVREIKEKAGGRLSRGIDQDSQLKDLEAWMSPAAQVVAFV